MKRWPLEVAIEERRVHLSIETQRQWSDPAIARTTPCLLGLFSLVTLFAQAGDPDLLLIPRAEFDRLVNTACA